MTNIPTDLLRTFVAVVDLRSFTKAAVRLGVTQPAVSAQIKRLQSLLGGDLFDRSVQGVSLTAQGELVVSYARRLLSINDQIVHIRDTGPRPELVIRVGTPSEYIASQLPGVFAQFRERRPDVRFVIRSDNYDPLVRQLRSGDIDIMLGLSMMPPHDARYSRAQEVVWVHNPATRIDPDKPVPLVAYSEHCVYHRAAVQVLQSAGLNWEDVLTSPGAASLTVAVNAGLGIMAVTRQRANKLGLAIWEDAPLPKLPDLYSGIYVREGGARAIYEELADDIAAMFYDSKPDPAAARPGVAAARKAGNAA
ncbi:MAG TPA: LysR family transcriptional regulator [Pseudolabrys sp.]|nr:LysR family transcriptional regulator [Pseudolabrys sp.]